MNNQLDQVKALRESIIHRARELADEHIHKGKLERSRILHEVRDKVQVMEKKELLAAKEEAEREFHRLVQANELKMQAELDRNRWGLVQSVMDIVAQRVASISADTGAYEKILVRLLERGVKEIGLDSVVAEINSYDRKRFADKWPMLIQGVDASVALSAENCDCSGGIRVYSEDGEMMIDNTFEGIMNRCDDELMRLIFERLFSKVQGIGVASHG